MSGVWKFGDGVIRLVEDPEDETKTENPKPKVLVFTQVITSYSDLERHLTELGWERNNEDPGLLQFQNASTGDIISLPTDFSMFKPMHMYDIVIKNRNMFHVRDM